MKYWLVKQEPAAYPWEQFVKDGKTAWTGVRNFQARNNLRAMEVGDEVFYYHSVTGKAVVGLARVEHTAYADPTATDGDWSCVDLVPEQEFSMPVTLDAIKLEAALAYMALIRQSRLSVMPVTKKEAGLLKKMGGVK